ncbi:MAG: D-alanyl-D-alanine carboxypeptidase [Oscillospiraceae bacterium]|nr:D-alanyl-D-alanine carboxypeptidase [Oscillospiraceae bacterium]
MKKQFFLVVLALFLLISALAPPVLADPLDEPRPSNGPEHHALAVILADAKTGEILYAQNPNQRIHPASTTKIITALLAVEALARGDVAIGDTLVTTETALADMIATGMNIGLEVGEEMSFQALLYAAMLVSANDATNVIAEHLGGSIDGFVEMMNERAAQIGAEDTNFTNPHGLTADNHYTTAYDMFLISRAAMNNPRFVELLDAPERPFAATNLRGAGIFSSTNLMTVYGSAYYYPGAFGIKTGFTLAAGFCLVSTATRDDVALMAVVMGVSQGEDYDGATINHFTETARIYDWAFDTFTYQELRYAGQRVASVPVSMAEGADSVYLRTEEAITALMPVSFSLADLSYDIVIHNEVAGYELVAPITQGRLLGEITLFYGDRSFGPFTLYAASNIRLSRWDYIQQEVTDTFDNIWVQVAIVVLLLLFVLYIVYVVRHAILKRRRRRARMGRR